MDTIILGAGLAGLSLAYFLNRKTVVLEKEVVPGGLCRSFALNDIVYDIGPHALFSKNSSILSTIIQLTPTNRLRRSNKVYYKNRFVKYPFENDLYALDPPEREYCLKEFLVNPYENYPANTMLQFFLKTFGEGITKIYLQPYNEKIWKFDPAFMDTQMVERIPKPPKEDVIKSAQGIPTEGYLHQLYFYYPQQGGIQQLIHALIERTQDKTEIITSVGIEQIFFEQGTWCVTTKQGVFRAATLINCMPLHELLKCLEVPEDVRRAAAALRYNSIHIVALQCLRDNIGENFAVYVPDTKAIFHRISKVDFLGKYYCRVPEGSTVLAEITYRPNSYLADVSPEEIVCTVIRDFDRIGLIKENDIVTTDIRSFHYAYVIYDLAHRENTDKVLQYLSDLGIICCGRFAEFEYLNMDAVFEHSLRLAAVLNGTSHD
ncbi:MAG: FAD-dependent oxidoreductase [Desulfobacterota bacterium]|nr:FAD-dependent oxidoreductase [Thermodesulfobacteriota bacterium]